jgi:thiazole synthase
MPFHIATRPFPSRLILATDKYASLSQFHQVLRHSASRIAVIGIRELEAGPAVAPPGDESLMLLPSTTGAQNAREAVAAAERARELLETNWVLLHLQGDARLLLPDGNETLAATHDLVDRGFVVLPLLQADPVLARALEDRGAAALFVLGSPMGGMLGLEAPAMFDRIVAQSRVPVILVGGIATPSQAASAMERGAAAVVVHTAIATSGDPIRLAAAFRLAVEAGRTQYELSSANVGSTRDLTAFLDV